MRTFIALSLALIVLAPAPAAAQGVQRPTRPYRGLFGGGPPPDPNRTRQELTLTASALGGYDDWFLPGATSAPVDPRQQRHSGETLMADLGVRYSRGRAARGITLDGRAYMEAYSSVDIDPTVGGEGRVRVDTDLGRTLRLQGSYHAGYQPTLVLGAFTTAADPAAAPVTEADVTSGYTAQRSVSNSGVVNLDGRWTPRQTSSVAGGYSRLQYLDELGHDSRSWTFTTTHTWALTAPTSLRWTYGFNDTALDEDTGLGTPFTHHNAEMAWVYQRRLSPSRQLQMSAGAGATYVRTLHVLDRTRLTYWTPSATGAFLVDVGRSWAFGGNYRRAPTVLQGVTLTSFATDSATLRLSGLMARRLETALSTTYANGHAGGSGTDARYQSYIGSAQLRYALSRCCAATVGYDYYIYRFTNVIDLPAGFPTSYDRQAVRVGLTLWLPLYGTYVDGEGRRGPRGGV